MRDNPLTREGAVTRLDELRDEFRHAIEDEESAKAAIHPRHHANDPDFLAAERRKLDASGSTSEILESGVIPWLEPQSISSFQPEMELWATRIKMKVYDGENSHLEKGIALHLQGRQMGQSFPLSLDMVKDLLAQLTYELERWNDE